MNRIDNLHEFLKAQGQLKFKEPKKKKRVHKQVELPGAQKREAPSSITVGFWWDQQKRLI